MAEPLVSVVIPTYNREATIVRAVQSALDQSYRKIQVIVVDDGSRDGTATMLERFGDRILAFRQPNAGASAARNTGIAHAQGEIVAFLDSDDFWLPRKIEAQVNLLERLGPSVPCCLCNIDLPHKPFGKSTSFELADLHPPFEEGVWQNPTEILLTRFILFNQAVAIRKNALNQVGTFDRRFRVLEDYDFALRLSMLGDWAFVRKPLVSYGIGQANSLSQVCEVDKTLAPTMVLAILAGIPSTGRFAEPAIQSHMHRRMRKARRQIHAARLEQNTKWGDRLLGKSLAMFTRLRAACWRRSPFYPTMRVTSISDAVKANSVEA